MKKILDIITAKMQQAFVDAGYDASFGRVTVSNRPDLCEYQCNGALAAAKQYKCAPIQIANAVVVGLIISIIATPALNALALGDEVATGLGVNTGLVRLVCAAAGVILCGATTAIAGPIGFVGLMIPHTIRLILGSNMKSIVPMSAIGGAILLTISDVIGRVIGSPGELEVGIITAFLGAPILVIIARKAKVKSI